MRDRSGAHFTHGKSRSVRDGFAVRTSSRDTRDARAVIAEGRSGGRTPPSGINAMKAGSCDEKLSGEIKFLRPSGSYGRRLPNIRATTYTTTTMTNTATRKAKPISP